MSRLDDRRSMWLCERVASGRLDHRDVDHWAADNKLSNGGENVKLSLGSGTPIIEFVYDDAAPWPTSPAPSGSGSPSALKRLTKAIVASVTRTMEGGKRSSGGGCGGGPTCRGGDKIA